MTVKEFGNDSKKRGDLKNGNRSTARLGQKTALRKYKKSERQLAKENLNFLEKEGLIEFPTNVLFEE